MMGNGRTWFFPPRHNCQEGIKSNNHSFSFSFGSIFGCKAFLPDALFPIGNLEALKILVQIQGLELHGTTFEPFCYLGQTVQGHGVAQVVAHSILRCFEFESHREQCLFVLLLSFHSLLPKNKSSVLSRVPLKGAFLFFLRGKKFQKRNLSLFFLGQNILKNLRMGQKIQRTPIVS